MVIVAQLVRASDCGSEGRGFETRLSPLTLESPEVIQGFFYLKKILFLKEYNMITKMKISKYRILAYSVFITILCIHIFLLRPYVKEKYFDIDIRNFKDISWKFSLLLPFVVFVIFIVYGFRKKIINIVYIFSVLLVSTLFGFFFKSITDDFLLFLNSKINLESHIKTYHVVSDDTNKIFHIYENSNEFITYPEQLDKIDSLRIVKKYPSLYKLKKGDTLKVAYKKGLFDVKFLE